MKRDIKQEILNLLDEMQITYELSEHAPTITSEDSARVRGTHMSSGAKAMIAKSKKSGNYYQFVLPADQKIDWKKANILTGENDLRLASEEEIENLTGLVRGSIPPFGRLFGIRCFYDNKILENVNIDFNVASVTHSINMKLEDLVRAAQPELVNFIQEEK